MDRRIPGSLIPGIFHHFPIITRAVKRKTSKNGLSSSHLRCVKETRLTGGELRRAEGLSWESEIGSLSQSLASHTLYLFLSSSSPLSLKPSPVSLCLFRSFPCARSSLLRNVYLNLVRDGARSAKQAKNFPASQELKSPWFFYS